MSKIKYMPKLYWLYLIGMTIMLLIMQIFPYNHYISIMIQMFVVGVTIIFYRNKPIVSLAAILMLQVVPSQLFYASNSEFQSHYQLNSTMVVIMCLMLFVYRLWQKKGNLKVSRVSTITFFLALFMCLSMLWTDDRTYYNSDFFIIPILYLTIPYFINDEYDIRFAWMAFSVSGAFFVLKMLLNTLNIGTIYDIKASIDRNYLALFTMIGLMVTAIALFQKNRFKNKIYLLMLAGVSVVSVVLVLTYASRTAFILMAAFTALLLVYVCFHNKKAVVLIVCLAAIAIWWGATSDAGVFLIKRFSDSTLSTANGRTDIARIYMSEFLSGNIIYKLMGHGYKAFRATHNGVALFAHNSYLAFLMDFGLIGECLYVLILFRTLKHLWHSDYKIVSVAFVVMLVYMFALEVHQDIAGICFLMTCAGIGDVNRKSHKNAIQNLREYVYEKNIGYHSCV